MGGLIRSNPILAFCPAWTLNRVGGGFPGPGGLRLPRPGIREMQGEGGGMREMGLARQAVGEIVSGISMTKRGLPTPDIPHPDSCHVPTKPANRAHAAPKNPGLSRREKKPPPLGEGGCGRCWGRRFNLVFRNFFRVLPSARQVSCALWSPSPMDGPSRLFALCDAATKLTKTFFNSNISIFIGYIRIKFLARETWSKQPNFRLAS